jgi:D-apiose dehydrogenase
MSVKPLKGVLVGAGSVTQFHMQAWSRIPDVEIVAIADIDIHRAQERADEYHITHVYSNFVDLLAEHDDLDFVDIATPPQSHLALVKLAAENGLHITCQKPFAPTLADAQQMIDLSESAGVLLNINENWRWRRWFREIKKLLTEGVIGRPVYCRIFCHSSSLLADIARKENRPSPGQRRFREWPRMVMFEWGVHHVDVIRYLFGEPETVYARMTSIVPEFKGEERVLAVYSIGELTTIIDISWSSYDPYGMSRRYDHVLEDVRIEGDKGTIALVPHPEKGDLLRVTTIDGADERPAYDGEPIAAYLQCYVDAQQHFIDCLRNGNIPETHAADNFNSLAATLAAYYSVETNQAVAIADYKKVD